MTKYSLYCLPVLCAVMSPLSADGADNAQQSPKQITPPAPPLVKRFADPFITAEYIYWKANQEGTDYAATGIAPGFSSFSGDGSVHQPIFRYNSGFKAGFGLKFRHDSWDMLANYTWLFSDGNHDRAYRKNSQSMQNTWEARIDSARKPGDIRKARTEWAMHFNVIDLEMGRNYFISPSLSLRPQFGLKLAWIDQNLAIKYSDALLTQASVAYKLDQDKFGVGIRAGFNTTWFMWKKWSVFGNFAATALYSDFDVEQYFDYRFPDNAKADAMDFKRDVHTVTPVLEFALGIRFETNIFSQNYQYMFQLGWEEQIWFNENQFSSLSNGPNGNLTLQGLTAKMGFAF